MFETGILGTLEDIGYSIRNNAFTLTCVEIWKCNMHGSARGYPRDVEIIKTNISTESVLK